MEKNNTKKDKDGLLFMNSKKKNIQNYWTKNVPGLIDSSAPIDSKEFYIEIDAHRYRQESYLPKYIKEICEPGKKILEIGCGLGTDSRQFAKEGMKAVVMDLSFSNVLHTKRGFEILGLKGYFVTADAEHLPFKEGAFDIVYSYGVLHHTPDTKAAISEIWRILRYGGKTLVMLYNKGTAYLLICLRGLFNLKPFLKDRENFISKRYDYTPLSKMFNKKEVLNLFDRFVDISVRYVNFGGAYSHGLLRLYYTLIDRFSFLLPRLASFIIIRAYKENIYI